MVVIEESDGGTKALMKKKLKKMKESVDQAIAGELNLVWANILNDAIRFCPKETGALASTIKIIEGMLGGLGMGRMVGKAVFDRTIIAGDATIINPKSGIPVIYASWVHDGHIMPDGTFWGGIPFLTEALANNEGDLMKAVERALKRLGKEFERN